MSLDSIANLTWGRKVRKIKEKIDISDIDTLGCNNLDDYLNKSNQYASSFIEERGGNILKNLYHFKDINPCCRHYSLYTYAVFTSLVERENLSFDKDVIVMAGAVVYKKDDKIKAGLHMWLGIDDEESWDLYEPIVKNRDYIFHYKPWFCFDVNGNKTEAVSCVKGGSALLIHSGLML
jgi:hypothetical protein